MKTRVCISFDDGIVITRQFESEESADNFIKSPNPIGMGDGEYYPRHRVRAYKLGKV